jgi:hypothetical protein
MMIESLTVQKTGTKLIKKLEIALQLTLTLKDIKYQRVTSRLESENYFYH